MISVAFSLLQVELLSKPQSHGPLLPDAEQQMLQDLMSDAMEETDSLQSHTLQSNGQELPLIYITM